MSCWVVECVLEYKQDGEGYLLLWIRVAKKSGRWSIKPLASFPFPYSPPLCPCSIEVPVTVSELIAWNTLPYTTVYRPPICLSFLSLYVFLQILTSDLYRDRRYLYIWSRAATEIQLWQDTIESDFGHWQLLWIYNLCSVVSILMALNRAVTIPLKCCSLLKGLHRRTAENWIWPKSLPVT